MTENKRFTIAIDSNNLKSLWDNERTEEEPLLWLTRSDKIGGIDNVCKLLNELYEENNEIKQLIYTMLVQIDVEKVNTENTRYSARIIFTFEEFKKIRQIWKGDVE